MALYEKKLHIRKNGVVTDINLWTESGEAGTPALHIRDGVNLVHARLGEVTDGLASDLRVRKDNVVYAVLKNRWVTINIVQSANQTITVSVDGSPHTESFAVPYGTAFTATITAAAGFSPGALSSIGGTAEGDVTISATPATASGVATGNVVGIGNVGFKVPEGVTVIHIAYPQLGRYYYVGVSSRVSYKVSGILYRVQTQYTGEFLVVYNLKKGTSLVLSESGGPPGLPNSLQVNVYWSPEINAHGPTDGSVA
jgi:hypothetical protein